VFASARTQGLMAAVAERVSACASCGDSFVDLTPGGQRTYCYACSPLRSKRAAVQSTPVRAAVMGKPFTIEHFRAWAKELELVSGERFVLEEWEDAFVADLLAGMRAGWLKEAWLVVPEGNGKSTLIAVLILYCVEFAREAAIPVAASARDQANIIFTQAAGFVRRTAGMAARFVCKPGLREIVLGEASKAKIFASDAGTGDGIIPFPIEVIDELHRHKTLELYRTWAGKLDKEAAVLVVISTAGEPGSEFEDVREQMRQSAETVEVSGCFGRYVGAASLLHEYAVPEGGDVFDLELVKAANPSSRITVETLAAKRARPSWALPHWQRLTCNMPTRTVESAITEAEWMAARADVVFPEGEPVWLGLDLGWKVDPTAMVPLWVRDPEFRLFGPATILEPPVSGDQLDAHLVERALAEIHARNPIHTVVMDMTNGAQLSQWIGETLGAQVVDRTQSVPMACLDYARFMEALREGWLHHIGDPGLTSHALNAVARLMPQGDMRFERPRESRTVRRELARRRWIDALVAAAMVHTTAVAVEEEAPLVAFSFA
ncbi:MAG TPA: terminase large subunit, partial [Candidatus Acidoferrum sp.]|nr:terminase large subunit [Candidatus Acidoferrum sp.]